ncbi:MAG: hypothetical protein ACLQBJ_17375 [Bryobacteraceae bacterium]
MSPWPRFIKYFASASFLSLVIGAIALLFELRSGKTNLTVDVAAESNVLDVRTSLPELAVLFRGQDIQQENLNLKILTVRIANDGEVNILEGYFDSRIPWGLQIDRGRLVTARITGSNSRYLLDNLRPRLADDSHVSFEKFIFDKGKYFTLELLVLHNKNIEPQVRVTGKIAGLDEVAVTSSFKGQEHQGLLGSVFRGTIAVQIARTIAYFVIGLIAIITVGFLIAGTAEAVSSIKKRSRRRLVRYLAKADKPETEAQRQALLEIFIEKGVPGLRQANAILRNERSLKRAVRIMNDHARLKAVTPDLHPEEIGEVMAMDRHGLFDSTVAPLIREGFVRVVGDSLQIMPGLPELLSALIAQLSEDDNGATGSPAKPD